MANGNNYAQTNNEILTEIQNTQQRQQAELNNINERQNMQSTEMTNQTTGTTLLRPSPTPNSEDQDTFSEILAANLGAYVLIQFLIGSASVVDKEGYLYAVGANFVTIYEPLDDRYVVCDLYSVKFVTIYNTPPIGNSMRTGNAMSYSGANANRYTRNYTTNSRRGY